MKRRIDNSSESDNTSTKKRRPNSQSTIIVSEEADIAIFSHIESDSDKNPIDRTRELNKYPSNTCHQEKHKNKIIHKSFYTEFNKRENYNSLSKCTKQKHTEKKCSTIIAKKIPYKITHDILPESIDISNKEESECILTQDCWKAIMKYIPPECAYLLYRTNKKLANLIEENANLHNTKQHQIDITKKDTNENTILSLKLNLFYYAGKMREYNVLNWLYDNEQVHKGNLHNLAISALDGNKESVVRMLEWIKDSYYLEIPTRKYYITKPWVNKKLFDYAIKADSNEAVVWIYNENESNMAEPIRLVDNNTLNKIQNMSHPPKLTLF